MTTAEGLPRRGASLPRRPNLADVAVLMAAVGVGLAWYRTMPVPWPGTLFGPTLEPPWAILKVLIGAEAATRALMPSLAALSVAFMFLSLRRPRPSLRRLTRRPGFVACASASVVLVLEGSEWLVHRVLHRWATGSWLPAADSFMQWIPGSSLMLDGRAVIFIGYAVAAGWTMLALGGCRGVGRNWIDRVGWAIGWCWLLLLAWDYGRRFLIFATTRLI